MDPTSESQSLAKVGIRQQEGLADLGQLAAADEDRDQVLRRAAETVAEAVQAGYTAVLEPRPSADEAVLRAGVGWPDGAVGSATVSAETDSLCETALHGDEPVVVDGDGAHERLSDHELFASSDITGAIAARIGAAAEPWGVLLACTDEHREFADREAAFLRRAADILASAIDRAEREREWRRKERRYEATFEDPNILVGLLDPDGTVLDINGTAMEYVDASLADVTGEPFWETPWWGGGDGVRAEVREWVERAASGEYVDFEADLTRPDGERYTLSGSFRPVTDEDGEVVSIIVSDKDVTERKRRERALEESERRYRTLVEHFPNGAVALVDEDLTYRTVGGRPLDVAGVTSEEVEGQPVETVLPETLAAELVPRYEAAFDGESSTVEIELGDRYFQFQVVPVRDDDGDVFTALGMSQDVTEREETKRRLEHYREYTDHILNAIDDVFYVLNADGTLQRWNESVREVTGYTDAELASIAALDLFPEDEHESIATAIAEVFETGSSQAEAELLTMDGDRIPYEFVASRLEDPEGNTVLAGIGRDITQRKERERALEESERRHRTLVENFPDGAVGLFDEDLEYTAIGGQLLEETDVSAEDRVGDSVYDIYPDEIVSEVAGHFRAALAGEANSFEVEYHDRHLHAHTLPVRNADGEVFAGMLVVQDVTERREYERKLEASNERLEQFAYAASHDLQEPLRMVSSYLQLIDQRYGDELDEDGREFLEFAVDGADRMREMIEGLLTYSRVDTQAGSFEPVDLDAILADVRQDLAVKIEETNAEITAEVLPEGHGDGGQLAQVFQNLLSNAMEYSGNESPCVHVSAERRAGEWVISIEDEGIGVDPVDADRVFEVFQRLHTQDEHSGTGIGLALCERIVERHGGDIWVDSEPGEGATFSFTLPAVDDGNG